MLAMDLKTVEYGHYNIEYFAIHSILFGWLNRIESLKKSGEYCKLRTSEFKSLEANHYKFWALVDVMQESLGFEEIFSHLGVLDVIEILDLAAHSPLLTNFERRYIRFYIAMIDNYFYRTDYINLEERAEDPLQIPGKIVL